MYMIESITPFATFGRVLTYLRISSVFSHPKAKNLDPNQREGFGSGLDPHYRELDPGRGGPKDS